MDEFPALETMSAPRFSVLITSYRSLRFLQDCLGTVLKSAGPDYEVLFLENGSPEPEADYLEKAFPDPRLRVFRGTPTRYFAGGINFLAPHARGEYLVLLNSDTRVDRDWLQVMDDYLKSTGYEAAQADLRTGQEPFPRESLGYWLDRLGFIVHIPEKGMPHPGRIFCARGAAFAIRRDVFFEIGALDESFRMYFEETDLCWRVNLFGYRIGYASGSIVYHLGGGSSRKSFFQWNRFRFTRNRISSLIKNFGRRSLLFYLPCHLAFCAGSALRFLLRGQLGMALAEALAIPSALILMGPALRNRKWVQSQRRVKDQELIDQGLILRKFKYRAIPKTPSTNG